MKFVMFEHEKIRSLIGNDKAMIVEEHGRIRHTVETKDTILIIGPAEQVEQLQKILDSAFGFWQGKEEEQTTPEGA